MTELSLQGYREITSAATTMSNDELAHHRERLLDVERRAVDLKIARQMSETARLIAYLEFEQACREGASSGDLGEHELAWAGV